MQHFSVDTNGVRLHVVQDGPTDGPLVILLHGFPEFWYGWRHQIADLAGAGFWVWAPDQRGYNRSDKPEDIASYSIDTLAADVVGLIDAAGRQKAIVAGHDWGAAVAWWVAVVHPERVERLVVLNVPHPVVMKRFASRNLEQMLRSWYIGFFQLPKLPERLLSRNNYQMLVKTLLGSSRPGTFTRAELEQYKEAWAQPGALTAMINWYRALWRSPASHQKNIRVKVPTLLIWGARDRFLMEEMAPLSIDLCDNGRLLLCQKATHWIQHEEVASVLAGINGELVI